MLVNLEVLESAACRPLPYRDPHQLIKISENFAEFTITGMQLVAVELDDLRARAWAYVHEAMLRAPGFGRGHGPLDHAWPMRGKA